jgi:hypothetical protein
MTPMYRGVGAVTQQTTNPMMGALRPIITGVLTGTALYALSRKFDVKSDTAWKLAFVWGGISALSSIGLDYLAREAQAIVAAGGK